MGAGGRACPATPCSTTSRARFVDVSEGSGADLAVRGNGCVAADFDLDGHTDLYVTGADAARSCGTRATGRSPRGREDAGAPAVGWYAGAAVGDVDGDGWPDLFVAGYANLDSPVAGRHAGLPQHLHRGPRPALPERGARRRRAR